MRYKGILYRAHKPARAAEPLSGEGANITGGRFNPKGVPALYTSLAPETAVKEYLKGRQPLQPYTMVAYEADVLRVFDAVRAEDLAAYGMTPEGLAADWRPQTYSGGKAQTQIFAERLIADGFDGIKAPSFAPAAGPEDMNMTLWRWEGMLRVIDAGGLLNTLRKNR